MRTATKMLAETTTRTQATQRRTAPVPTLVPSFLDDLQEDQERRKRERRMNAPLGPRHFPPVEVVRQRDRVTVRAEVPGITWSDIRVNLRKTDLVLEGERLPDEREEQNLVRREGAYGRFCRWLPLDVEVIPSEMKVRLRDGILRLEVPIAAPAA